MFTGDYSLKPRANKGRGAEFGLSWRSLLAYYRRTAKVNVRVVFWIDD